MGRPKGSKNKPKNKRAAKAAPVEKTTKRKYTKRAVVAGGTRAGAGRKSSEVHFAQLNSKIDALAAKFGVVFEEQVAPAPVAEVAAPAASEAPAPAPKKRGRPPKVKPAEVAATPAAPTAPVEVPVITQAPAPVAVAAPAAPVVQLAPAPIAPPQAFVPAPVQIAPAPLPQFIAPPVAPPVVFAPPQPVAVQPGYISVQPASAPTLQPPTAPNQFEQQFQQAMGKPEGQ